MKFIIDMNLSPEWCDTLAPIAEAVHWSQVGAMEATDEDFLFHALKQESYIFTNDLDFGAILAATQLQSPSVFQLRSLILDPSIIGDDVLACLKRVEPDLAAGALVSFDIDQSRIRKLPIF